MKQRNYIREAGAECASLLTEGYVMKVHHYDDKNKTAYSTLQHTTNGNIIHINATPAGYCITKNGTIVKHVKQTVHQS